MNTAVSSLFIRKPSADNIINDAVTTKVAKVVDESPEDNDLFNQQKSSHSQVSFFAIK